MARLLVASADCIIASALYEQARPVIRESWPWMVDAASTAADFERMLTEGYVGYISDANDAVFMARNLRAVARGIFAGEANCSELMLALLAAALNPAAFRRRGIELFRFWFAHQQGQGIVYAWTELPRSISFQGRAFLDSAATDRWLVRDDFTTDEAMPDGSILAGVSWSQYSCRIADALAVMPR